MTLPTAPYAMDEDIALRAPEDFALIVPRDQEITSGTDGEFLAGDPWTLSSASVNFLTAGAAPGQIVQLFGPPVQFPPPGALFAVGSVTAAALTLRRLGQPTGSGHPPAPLGGLTGVQFAIRTLAPQVTLAGADLIRRLALGEGSCGRHAYELCDPAAFREAVVLSVLARRYLDLGESSGADGPNFLARAARYSAELEQLLECLVLHAGPQGAAASTAAAGRFVTRLSR